MKDEDKDKEKFNANEIVSPKNTSKIYKDKNLEGVESRPGDAEAVETALPEDFSGVDQEVGHTMYPNKSSRDPHESTDL